MWFALFAIALAGSPPIPAPCCGAKPIQHTDSDALSVTPEPARTEPNELLALMPYQVGGKTVRQSVCDLVKFCGPIDCDHPADSAHHHRSWTSDTLPAGDGLSLRVEAFGMGTFVCSVDRWAAVVDGPKGTRWLNLLDGGGGTKGGTATHLKQFTALGDGLFWVEIQQDHQHTMAPREVVLNGFVVGMRDGEPVLLASKIPVWVDGEQYAGPRQIDVAVKGDRMEITARTPLVAPSQAKWLGSWTLERTAAATGP